MSTFNQPPIIETGDLNDIVTEPYELGLPVATVQTHAEFVDPAFQDDDNGGWPVPDVDDVSLVQCDITPAPQLSRESIANDLIRPFQVSPEAELQAHPETFEPLQPRLSSDRITGKPVQKEQVRNIHDNNESTFIPHFSDRLQAPPHNQAPNSLPTAPAQQAQNALGHQQNASADDVQSVHSCDSLISPLISPQSSSVWQENAMPSTSPSSFQAINSSTPSASRPHIISSNNSIQSIRKKVSTPNSRNVPSHYCHICGRNSRIEFGHCANIKLGLCRKVVCEKCLILHEPESLQRALDPDSGWLCIHCRQMCPENARCKQYIKNNHKRREKKAKERMEREKVLDGKRTSPAGLRPQNTGAAAELDSITAEPPKHTSGNDDKGSQSTLSRGQPPFALSEERPLALSDDTCTTRNVSLPPSVSVAAESATLASRCKTRKLPSPFKLADDNNTRISLPVVSSKHTSNELARSAQILSPHATCAAMSQAYNLHLTMTQSTPAEQGMLVLHQHATMRAGHENVRLLTKESKGLILINTTDVRAVDSGISHTSTLASSLATRLGAEQAAKIRTISNSNLQASQTIDDKQNQIGLQSNRNRTDGKSTKKTSQQLPPQNIHAIPKDAKGTHFAPANQIIPQRGQITSKKTMAKNRSAHTHPREVERVHSIATTILCAERTEDQSGNQTYTDQYPKVSEKRKRGTEDDSKRKGTRRKIARNQFALTNVDTRRTSVGDVQTKQSWQSQPESRKEKTNEAAFDSRKHFSIDEYGNVISNAVAEPTDVVDVPDPGLARTSLKKRSDERRELPRTGGVRDLDTFQDCGTENCVSPTGIQDAFARDDDIL